MWDSEATRGDWSELWARLRLDNRTSGGRGPALVEDVAPVGLQAGHRLKPGSDILDSMIEAILRVGYIIHTSSMLRTSKQQASANAKHT